MYEFRYQRHSVKLLFGLSLFDQCCPIRQKLLPCTTCWTFTWLVSLLYLPRKHTMDHCVRRKSLAGIMWGWTAPPKPGYPLRQTWAWQLLEDQISTCCPLATAHSGCRWDTWSGEGPRGGTRTEELSTAAVISYKQLPAGLQRPVNDTVGPNPICILAILAT